MKLIHYTGTPIEKLDRNWDYGCKMTQRTLWAKPSGLWISIEDGDGWKDWCQDEDFRLEYLTYKYKIELDSNANILKLQTVEDILKFTEQYWWNACEWISRMKIKDTGSVPKKSEPPIFYGNDRYRSAIRWDVVKEKYQGIIIAPYQWDCRMEIETAWYYGWDCSSGCIWDLNCIKEFNLICSEPVSQKPETCQ